jgi:hypothetical protein
LKPTDKVFAFHPSVFIYPLAMKKPRSFIPALDRQNPSSFKHTKSSSPEARRSRSMKNKKASPEDKKSFWTTLPGILTGLAAVLTALGGLLAAFNGSGLFSSKDAPTKDAPAPAAPPAFVTHYVYDLGDTSFGVKRVEFEFERGMLPEENISSFLELSRVAFGRLEDSQRAFNVRLAIKNTSARPLQLDLDERFFRLEDNQGRAAELIYFCCASTGEILSAGQVREAQLFFRALPGWSGKETSARAVFFRVAGLLPIIRAAWQFPVLVTAA